MKLWKLPLACVAMSISMSGQASTVFDVSGIEGIEWLELNVTERKSRSEVELLLASGGDLEGWRYATRTEVETLYDSLWGGTTEGYSADNFAGAQVFFNQFGLSSFYGETGYDEYGASLWQTIFGEVSECGGSETSCLGYVAIYDMAFGASLNVGSFSDDYGLSTGIDGTNTQATVSNSYFQPYTGSHLVRDITAVPVPAAFWLFGSGLVGLFAAARRKR